jgi:hypothetical protein
MPKTIRTRLRGAPNAATDQNWRAYLALEAEAMAREDAIVTVVGRCVVRRPGDGRVRDCTDGRCFQEAKVQIEIFMRKPAFLLVENRAQKKGDAAFGGGQSRVTGRRN